MVVCVTIEFVKVLVYIVFDETQNLGVIVLVILSMHVRAVSVEVIETGVLETTCIFSDVLHIPIVGLSHR